MDIILIPGFWLDGLSWDEVVPALERAGHRTHALTLPGMEPKDADRSKIGLRDHVDAVVPDWSLFDDEDLVDLPTGHWPQFTRPGDLGQAILASIGPA
jgi:hypothetical protein